MVCRLRGSDSKPADAFAGMMTVVVGAGGLVLYPDWPDRPNRWAIWLTKRDKDIAADRLERTGRLSPSPVTWRTMKRVLLNPMTYMMICIYVGMLIAPSGNTCASLAHIIRTKSLAHGRLQPLAQVAHQPGRQ